MRLPRAALALSLLSLPVAPAAGKVSPSTRPAATAAAIRWEGGFQRELDALARRISAPGISAAVILPDGTARTFVTGFSDVRTRRRLTPKDRFLAASIGKTIVAATAIALVQKGKVDLDAKIAPLIGSEPWFEGLPNARDLTLRMLLTHSSGIPDHADDERFIAAWTKSLDRPELTPTVPQLIGYVSGKPALFEAGRGFRYSDTNYLIAGIAIEKAGGKPFYELARELVLEPNRLQATSPSDRPKLAGLVQANLDSPNELGWEPDLNHSDGTLKYDPAIEWTGGGFLSTPADMAAWIRRYSRGEALQGAYLHQLFASVEAGADYRYGLGLEIRETTLGTAYQHTGVIPGYSSIAVYYPDRKIAVALMINKYSSSYRSADWLRSLVPTIPAAFAKRTVK